MKKVALDQTNDYLKEKKNYNYFYKFEPNQQTDSYLIYLFDEILKVFDKSWFTGIILIKFRGPHHTLLYIFSKCLAVGLANHVINLDIPFLSKKVCFENVKPSK